MTAVRIPPSQVTTGDLIRLVGMTEPGPVLWTRNAGHHHGWGCPVVEIAIAGAPEPIRQPESVLVEVLR